MFYEDAKLTSAIGDQKGRSSGNCGFAAQPAVGVPAFGLRFSMNEAGETTCGAMSG